MTSDKSIFREKKFQRRYFVLDLANASFRYAKTPTDVFKWYKFNELAFIITEGPELFCHKKYQHPFKVKVSERFYHLCAKSVQEKIEWVNGFNFLFAFRKHLRDKLSNKIIDGGAPVVDELEKYREEQKREQELKDQKQKLKEMKKNKKRDKSNVRQLSLNPIINALLTKALPSLGLDIGSDSKFKQ